MKFCKNENEKKIGIKFNFLWQNCNWIHGTNKSLQRQHWVFSVWEMKCKKNEREKERIFIGKAIFEVDRSMHEGNVSENGCWSSTVHYNCLLFIPNVSNTKEDWLVNFFLFPFCAAFVHSVSSRQQKKIINKMNK